ncbi:MAG: hypothetical protein WC890_01985 [Candidatus Margulisiibacteriota bacterium]
MGDYQIGSYGLYPSYLIPSPPVTGQDKRQEICCDEALWNVGTQSCGSPLSEESNAIRLWEAEGLSPSSQAIPTRLEKLSQVYQKAVKDNAVELAQRCQILAMKYVQAAEKSNMNRESIRPLAESMGIYIPRSRGRIAGVAHVASLYSSNSSGTSMKIQANLIDSGQDPQYINADLSFTSETPILFGGQGVAGIDISLLIDGTPTIVGKIIVVDQNIASLEYLPKEMNGPKAAQEGWIVFSSANYSVTVGNYPNCTTVPGTISIRDGIPSNLYPSSSTGAVVIRNGVPEILQANPDEMVALAAEAMSSGGTMFQSHLLVHNGESIVPTSSDTDRDVRRVLITLDSGGFALVQIDEFITLYELSKIIEKIPNIKEAVNLDTGGGNVGGYRTIDQSNGQYTPFGDGSEPGEFDDSNLEADAFIGVRQRQ